jgi:hypothetical protein
LTASKPIVVRFTRAGVAAGAADHRAQHRLVGGQAGDPGAAALEIARRPDLGLGENGGERALDEGHHTDDVGAPLAGEPEIVDVEHGEIDPARAQQPQRVGRRPRLADPQHDPLRGVEAALRRQVDPGVHSVGREVEQQARLRLGPVGARRRSTARQQYDQQREYD